ncbi:unnamed protein product [Gemmata massiliana]|uniref:Uncharacterized protein n=1 Tax=Gemmata massiliana TaxID=1210884 RepID=A0A6P2D0J1_9BACT|nr:hypothetical protein [Gemmata massiliana]VTR94106.1 unnamed protein product [Gemmata massiliana]
MTMCEPNRPTLTPTQRLEIELYEASICDNLHVNTVQPVRLTLDVAESVEDPAHAEKTELHVQNLAAVARYLASEGFATEHFMGAMLEFPMCSNVAWIIQGRDEYFAQPDSLGYAVLFAAGLVRPSGPPASQAA